MAKFAIYIIDLDGGTVQGTNDVEVANQFVEDASFVVLLAQHGVYFDGDRNEIQVEECAEDAGGVEESADDERED